MLGTFSLINLLRKLEKLEDFLDSIQNGLLTTIESMRAIDLRGAFEADDEVGLVFKGLRSLVLSLDVFLHPEDYEEKSSEEE